MSLSLLLAKVIGVAAIIKTLAILLRRKECMDLIDGLLNNKGLLYTIGSLELIAGLFMVNTHNIWYGGFPVVITIIGWLMVIEGIFIALFPISTVRKVFNKFNTPTWYKIGIVLGLVVGIYLASKGFAY